MMQFLSQQQQLGAHQAGATTGQPGAPGDEH
jgi:hypothetical protein